MKVIQAIPMPNQVTEDEVERFLQSKLNVQLATIDGEGYPNIQPVWFYFDSDSGKTYFSIDDENFPYKGVKGRGSAVISEDVHRNLPVIEKINMKYLGTLEHPLAKMLIENARNGTEVMIEITPKFFSAWDFSKVR